MTNASTRQLLAAVSTLDPLIEQPAPNDDDLVRARRVLQARLDLASEGTATGRARREAGVPLRMGGPRRSRLLVAAATAALVVAGSVTWQVAGAGRPGGASPAAAAALERAAAAAIDAQDPTLQPGQYLKVTTKAVWSTTAGDAPGGPLTWLDQEVIEVWKPADPSAEWVQRRSDRLPYRWLRPGDEQLARDNGLLEAPQQAGVLRAEQGAFYGPGSSPLPADVLDLPRDPEKLLAKIYDETEGAGVSRDGQALVWIADLLRTGLVPADLRAALFQAATGIPGVEVVDRRANLDGQVGVAVGRDERANGSSFRQELIFDQSTGQVIGERQVALEDDGTGISAGDAYSFTSVTTAVVDSAP